MADPMATAKAARAESQKVVERGHAEYKERTKGRPTPTQEESDLMRLGAPVTVSDPGAGPDPGVVRTMERGGRGGGARTAAAPAR